VINAGLLPKFLGDRGVVGVDVAGNDFPLLRHSQGHTKGAVAGEGANFDRPLRPQQLHQQSHELPLLRRNLLNGRLLLRVAPAR
jgi:hypothetical protein